MLRISTHYKLYEENETWYGFKGGVPKSKINTIKACSSFGICPESRKDLP